MFLRVDLHSPQPVFEQIAFSIKGSIARGDLIPGARLPSVRELAQELSINPNTVVRAYDLLEKDGVVLRRQGAGCFVTGRTSALATRERRKQLSDLAERMVTEAYHLGFDADDVRAAVDDACKDVRFDRPDKKVNS